MILLQTGFTNLFNNMYQSIKNSISSIETILKSEYMYDNGAPLLGAIATFLAVIVALFTTYINSRDAREEAKVKSKKTLQVLDFILEDHTDEIKGFLNQIKFIRNHTDEGIDLTSRAKYSSDEIEEWKRTRDRKLDIGYIVGHQDPGNHRRPTQNEKSGVPMLGPRVYTSFEDIYIIMGTCRYLNNHEFLLKLNEWEQDLKTSLKNQHLNITSDSLEIISDRIHEIKKSRDIFNSLEYNELRDIVRDEWEITEEQISEKLGQSLLEFISEENKKMIDLEEELKKLVRPLAQR